ncbi:alkaline phosphatase D family protein [Streptomyces sp. ME19-01-6]|uniref:alkaline phosphatase D family protein n=1 Tax=Streptomyces sp. ME19-01-6 TaxID=3028686 RepID=UPI0029BB2450|nr:alkaline phosphatase D family protein [Streptomyces sp. ME19-01-6]MDX3231762.1 alkaline phosphatase D family protein [Streptomyces sp. ME19-01-6]
MKHSPFLPPALSAATRRRFLTVTGAAAGLALSGMLPGISPATAATTSATKQDPFTLGVASGDPLPDGVVLWTRLAPDPLAPFGGMDQRTYSVLWEIAADERFSRVVQRGTAKAAPEYGHSVHVDVRGLEPAREYYYRFRTGGFVSPAGRTKTAPAPDQLLPSMTLAVASCQAIWEGWFTAHRDLAARHHDVVLFLGDYIYEFGNDRGVRPGDDDPLRTRQTVTLDEYRQRYAYYKTDPDLQAAHHTAPWIVVFDDHEVADNWADRYAGSTPPDQFLVRRANAFRAYWENLPLRAPQFPAGPEMQLYRRLRYGRLAEFSMLDTRQYRNDQANGDGIKAPNEATADPTRSILGFPQERWLLDGLTASQSTWNVLGHQTAITLLDTVSGPGVAVPMDAWDGYSASRDRLLGGIDERGVQNVVSLAGDLHRTVVSDLALDFTDPDSKVVATEFVGTSISSAQDGEDLDAGGRVLLEENPHMKFGNFQRGYISCEITPDRWMSEFRVCDRVTVPEGTVSTRTKLAVESGVAAVQQA